MFFLLLFTGYKSMGQDMEHLRQLYSIASKDEKACKELLTISKRRSGPPICSGYYGSGFMLMANHYYNPYKKLKCFIDGKEILENAIRDEPNNIELIFLRFSIQTNAPSFLGYHNNIRTDRSILSQSIPKLTDTDLRNRIQSYLKMK